MNKFMKGIVVAPMCLALLVGCASKDSQVITKEKEQAQITETAQNTQSAEPVEVRFWMRGSSKINNIVTLFDDFNAEQDKIKVIVEVYGDNYGEVLKLALNSGEAPDIFELAGGVTTAQIASSGQAEPLDAYITDDLRRDFSPSAFNNNDFSYEGQIYAIPEQTRYTRLHYNKTLFEKAGLDPNTPPQTLEEMYDYAKKITEAGKGEFYGFGLPIKSGSTWERNIDNVAILSGLTGPYGFDFTQGKFDFVKQAPIIEYFAKMYKDKLMIPGSETMDIEMIRANFSTDKIGMYMDGSWTVNMYNNEQKVDTNWETALVPLPDGTKRAKDYQTLALGRCIYSGSKVKEEAFEVLKYRFYNLEPNMAKHNPDTIPPAFSLVTAITQEINAMPVVQQQRGVKGITQDVENLSAFHITPHTYLTLEGDNRDSIYPLLIIEGKNIEEQLQKLSDTYNKALEVAVQEGKLKPEDLAPSGYDYYTR